MVFKVLSLYDLQTNECALYSIYCYTLLIIVSQNMDSCFDQYDPQILKTQDHME